MRNFIVLFFTVFCQVCFSQAGYIRQIADSNNIKIFGNVGFVDQDDNFLYIGANTTYDEGGFCNGSNGQCFILKIDKSTGATANSFNVSLDTMVMRINDGFYYNNAIYFAGKSFHTAWTPPYSFISKYNLQTNQIEWTKSFQNESHFLYGINNIKFNKIDSKIYFCGNDYQNNHIGGFSNCPSAFTIGSIDTLGYDFVGEYPGFSFINPFVNEYAIFTNSSMELLNSSNKFVISLNEYNSRVRVVVPIKLGDSWTGGTAYYTDSISDMEIVKKINDKIIRVVNSSNGINFMVLDTVNFQVLSSKNIDNVILKNVTTKLNRLIVTCIDSSSNAYSSKVINFEIDTALNVISSKSIKIDSLYSASCSIKSIFDTATGYIYNVFTKSGGYADKIYVYKMDFNFNSCNESLYSLNSSNTPISALTYTITYRDTIIKSTIGINKQQKNFINEDACPIITNVNKSQLSNNDLLLKTLLNNEFQIFSPSYIINQVVVYDMLGKKIFSNELKEYSSIINLQSYTNGLYFINVKCSNGKETTFKVIKGD